MPSNSFIHAISLEDLRHFSVTECVWFLDRGFDECLYKVQNNTVRKAFEIDGATELLELIFEDNMLIIKSLMSKVPAEYFVPMVKEWLDLNRDIEPFYQLLAQDIELAFMAESFCGLRLIGIPDTFEAICWSIIGQQINLNFAYSLKRRLCQTYGQSIDYQGQSYWMFPKAAVLAGLRPEDLMPMQFSLKKAEYLIEIARYFEKGAISKEKLMALPTTDAQKLLCGVRGIGEWSANYTLMKSLKRLECVTHGDAGLYQALHKLKGYPKKPDRAQIVALFDSFKGWEAYLTIYLWRSLVPMLS